jgi:hypothetical protein
VNFIRRLFMSSGQFPEEIRTQLAAEGVVMMVEGLRASITWRHYRAPGRRYSWRRIGTYGGVAVTGERLMVWAARHRQIDVPLRNPLIREIEASVDKPGRLLLAFDAHAFHENTSGRIEIRLNTQQADHVADLVSRVPA